MKKVLSAAIVFMFTSMMLSAQTTGQGNGRGLNRNTPGYVDANKNNICDNAENGGRARQACTLNQGRKGGRMMNAKGTGMKNNGCKKQGRNRQQNS